MRRKEDETDKHASRDHGEQWGNRKRYHITIKQLNVPDRAPDAKFLFYRLEACTADHFLTLEVGQDLASDLFQRTLYRVLP